MPKVSVLRNMHVCIIPDRSDKQMTRTTELSINEVKFTANIDDNRPRIIAIVGGTQITVAQFYSHSNASERYHAGIHRSGEYDCDTVEVSGDMTRLLNFHAARGSLDTARWDQITAVYEPAIRKLASFSLVKEAMKSQVDWS